LSPNSHVFWSVTKHHGWHTPRLSQLRLATACSISDQAAFNT
jgi:hypothetical protein